MDEASDRRTRRRRIFPAQFYLFGMIVVSATFAFIMQFVVDPSWGDRLFRGWIDPSLRLIAIPLVGLALGVPLMVILNAAYILYQRRLR